MPACARREIVREGEPGIFHCWSRCCRRAYLLGHDPLTGNNHDHRRQWIIERLQLLVANFVVDVCFLSVLSNHLHAVLRTTPRLVKRMGSWEVARRWLRVFPGRRVLDGQWIEPTEEQVQTLAADKEKIKTIRKRLSNISWFMSALSEYVARRANREDECSGRFWEGRFSCREITDEGALLVCGMYVDLNPIRAGDVRTPEEALQTSASFRIRARAAALRQKKSAEPTPDGWLAPLSLVADQLGDVPSEAGRRASDKGLLPMSLDEYLQLLDWCGREIHGDKRGAIPAALPPILERLGVVEEELIDTVREFPRCFRRLAGSVGQFAARAAQVGRRWLHGVRHAARVFR
jgi:REP element-mobilizing transposase RayT